MGQVSVKFDRQFSIVMKETEYKYSQKMARKGPRVGVAVQNQLIRS